MIFVVFCGKKPGLYKCWSECVNMLVGVEGSYFQAFNVMMKRYKPSTNFKKQVVHRKSHLQAWPLKKVKKL